MPLTELQEATARLLSANRSESSHLAGGAALHLQPNSKRYSNDLWRFLPPIKSEVVGYQLHPIDLAINKLLALAGRDEARDFLDILMIDREVLPLGALCWAAVGKDPGFSPRSLLELLKRRGKYRPEDFERLRLSKPVDLQALKQQWLEALQDAESFIDAQDPTEIGCLFYDTATEAFVAPTSKDRTGGTVVPHFGRPGGVLPSIRGLRKN